MIIGAFGAGWTCPVCTERLRPADLVVDGWAPCIGLKRAFPDQGAVCRHLADQRSIPSLKATLLCDAKSGPWLAQGG